MINKNLTVGMPLAVPHQKPPMKYASHPYPVFSEGSYEHSKFGVGTVLLKEVVVEQIRASEYTANLGVAEVSLSDIRVETLMEGGYQSAVGLSKILLQDVRITTHKDIRHQTSLGVGELLLKRIAILYDNAKPAEYLSKYGVGEISLVLEEI